MERVKVKDKFFVKYITKQQIEEAVKGVAERINGDYGDGEPPLMVGIMTGGFIFMADLIRELTFDCEVTTIKASSYVGDKSVGKVTVIDGLDQSIEGRDIILVDDIADSGRTLLNIKELLMQRGAASVKSVVFINKPHTHCVEVAVDYAAIVQQESNFIIGYGLDYDGLARGYREIYIAE